MVEESWRKTKQGTLKMLASFRILILLAVELIMHEPSPLLMTQIRSNFWLPQKRTAQASIFWLIMCRKWMSF